MYQALFFFLSSQRSKEAKNNNNNNNACSQVRVTVDLFAKDKFGSSLVLQPVKLIGNVKQYNEHMKNKRHKTEKKFNKVKNKMVGIKWKGTIFYCCFFIIFQILFLYLRCNCKSYPATVVILQSVNTESRIK